MFLKMMLIECPDNASQDKKICGLREGDSVGGLDV